MVPSKYKSFHEFISRVESKQVVLSGIESREGGEGENSRVKQSIAELN